MTARTLKTLVMAAIAACLLGFAAGSFAAERHPNLDRAQRVLRTAIQHAKDIRARTLPVLNTRSTGRFDR